MIGRKWFASRSSKTRGAKNFGSGSEQGPAFHCLARILTSVMESSGSGWFSNQHCRLALLFRIAGEIERAVDAPNYRDADRHQRLLHAAETFEWSDYVESHAGKVRDRAEHRNRHVFETVELMMLALGNDADNVGQSVGDK